MVFRVFLAHRASTKDSPLVSAIHDGLQEQDVECLVAEYYREPGTHVSAKVEQAILSCDVMVVLWTKDGAASAFVNQEVGFAKAKDKLVIPFVEGEVKLEGFLHGMDFIGFGRDTLDESSQTLVSFINELKLEDDKKNVLLAIGFIILGIIAIVLIIAMTQESS